MTSLVAIVGPTAVGKTALAIEIAAARDGEIVNADAGLFYRGFDIGTAKPTPNELQRVPHHLLDVLAPSETMGLAGFIDAAAEAIIEISGRGRLPILVGGTGQYVFGLLEDWDVPRVEPDPSLREQLEAEAAEHGPTHLHERLVRLDSEAAARIDARNVRRVIRAIEVARAGWKSRGASRKPEPQFESLVIGLTAERAKLYCRVDGRIDGMLAAGWLDEVRAHLGSGVEPGWPAMKAIGYSELAAHLRNEITLDEATAAIRRATRRLVRRQYNWFKLDDPRINWFQARPEATEAAMALVDSQLDQRA